MLQTLKITPINCALNLQTELRNLIHFPKFLDSLLIFIDQKKKQISLTLTFRPKPLDHYKTDILFYTQHLSMIRIDMNIHL